MKPFRKTLAMLLVSLSLESYAGAVAFEPTIGFETAHVDNLDLENRGGRSDFVSQINPEFILEIASTRVNANADYKLQNLFYHSNTDLNTTFHQFNADTTIHIIPTKFRLRSVASYDQQTISFDNPTGSNNLTGANNTTDRTVFGIEPVWITNITESLVAEMSTGYYRTGSLIDSNSTNYGINIYPFSNKTPLNWRLAIQQRAIGYDNDQERDIGHATASFDFPLTNLLSAVAEIGYETNDTDDGLTTETDNGFLYSAGFRWFPQGNATISLNYEDHWYGDFLSADIAYQKNRFAFTLTYDQEVTTQQDQDISNLTAAPGSVTSPVQTSSTDTFLQKTFSTTATYTYGRGKIALEGRFDDRETENSGSIVARPPEELTEINLDWEHDLTRRHTLSVSLFQRDRDVGSGRSDEDSIATVTFGYELNASLSGTFYLSSNHRNSNLPSSEYESTIIGASIHAKF
ncbi:MAG: TIGR03016 family PEP-CTERM system-associated outer membrane protein [Immundisolibacteraceae bacterium]|nr:TIGR03016 family PEP-CTERM system-associated outer membrane protein [Immundisolibacteraceae bacterium]